MGFLDSLGIDLSGIGGIFGTGVAAIVALYVLYVVIKTVYVVVPAHLAHIVVSSGSRTVYCSRDGYKPSYIFIPVLMQRNILPLENIKITIDDVGLHDQKFAPFVCDLVCWINIEDPIMAAERLGNVYHESAQHGQGGHAISESFTSVTNDIRALISSISRTASMKVELPDLMRDRKTFSKRVEEDCDVSLQKWGLGLQDLEILHFRDEPNYNVIKDLETRNAQEIETETRLLVADKKKEAEVAESNADRETRLQKADNEQMSRQKEINTEREISMAEQDMAMDIAEREKEANSKKVEAKRVLDVGNAKVAAEAAIEKANGEAEATIKTMTADAEMIELTGQKQAASDRAEGIAAADVEKASLLAEAEGKDKLADAMKKMNDSAINLETVYADRDVRLEYAKALERAYEKADIKIITSGESAQILSGGILGNLSIGGKEASSILAALEALDLTPEEALEKLKKVSLKP